MEKDTNNIYNAYLRFRNELIAESKLFSDFSLNLQEIKKAIHDKNWPLLEKKIQGMEGLSETISHVESMRNASFLGLKKLLGLNEKASVRRVLKYLGFEEREELQELHRDFQMKVLKVKVEYQNLGYYVKNISGFIYRFLEEIFPHTKGRIYSRQGLVSSPRHESVIVNQEL